METSGFELSVGPTPREWEKGVRLRGGVAVQGELQLSPDQTDRLLHTRAAVMEQVQTIASERQRIAAALQVRCSAPHSARASIFLPRTLPPALFAPPHSSTQPQNIWGDLHLKTTSFLLVFVCSTSPESLLALALFKGSCGAC